MSKIILAEDDDDMRRFLLKALERAAYDVVSFNNGQSAYERMCEESFTLLLTDIVMPQMDGIELARKATELDPDLKVMFHHRLCRRGAEPRFQRAQERQGAVEALPPARTGRSGGANAGRMSALQRLKPDPVPEYRVSGRRRELYEDTKEALQVPWMGVVTMVLADFEPYYEALWAAARPMMTSRQAIDACTELRASVEREIGRLAPPKRTATLVEMGYAPRKIDDIRAAIEVFSHGNFLYTMIATLSRLALEAGAFPQPEDGDPLNGCHAPDVKVPFVLIEEHHADSPTQAVYASIRETLGLCLSSTPTTGRWRAGRVTFHLPGAVSRRPSGRLPIKRS